MSTDTKIALPRSLHDYVACRADVVRLLTEADDVLKTADSALKRFYPYGLGRESRCYESLDRQIAEVDRKLWRQAFDKTGLHALMDAEARRKFEDALEKKPLPFTIENVRSEFLALSQVADAMFARGVYNVFRRLSRSGYRTNEREPFEIGRKCIRTGWFRPRWMKSGLEVNHYSADEINDIDRVFKTLAGAPYTPRSLESAISAAMADGPVYEDEFYRIRGFQNSNAHIEFKRADLLERVNRIIGDYCNGNALAAA